MMSIFSGQAAIAFDKMKEESYWDSWRQFFTQQPNNLLSFSAVKNILNLHLAQNKGIKEIAIDDIVGSVSRFNEFSRTFKPKHKFTEDRWLRVAESFYQRGFDPIKVFKVSNVYFVIDGNHRVSVSRAMDTKTICAHVYEFEAQIVLDKNDDLNSIRSKLIAA